MLSIIIGPVMRYVASNGHEIEKPRYPEQKF